MTQAVFKMFLKHGNVGGGETERFCPEIIRKHLQMWTELWNDVGFALAKKHHAQKIGHLMLDGEREEKCIQLCLNKSKRCMNKKQKEMFSLAFFHTTIMQLLEHLLILRILFIYKQYEKCTRDWVAQWKLSLYRKMWGDTLKFSLH